MNPPSALSPGRALLLALSVALLVAVALLATCPGLPMAWDEGNAIVRAAQIPRDWPYTTRIEGHPALYGIVIAAGRQIGGPWLSPLCAARLGPMMLFSLAAGAMAWRLARDFSPVAALGGTAALALLPRMFAHAHFASFDGPLVSCWILAWAAFAPTWASADRQAPRQRLVWAVLFGAALGATMSCKATGWLAVLPFAAFAALYRDRRAAAALAIGVPVALATFFLLNPPLWHQPIAGWIEFFRLNLNRAARPGLNISTRFLGRMYNLDHPLPWYNTLFWTAVTVPAGILVLSAIGAAGTVRRWRGDRAGVLLVANWLVLVIVRALPGTPPHDGVRLFLPSFAFLAALAGVGCHRVLAWAALRWPAGPRARRLAALALLVPYLGAASSLAWYAPQWLSYYSVLIGGLPGATAAGMEPTYYWDGLDRPVLDWLHEHTAEDQKIAFGACSPENLRLMNEWGVLRRATDPGSPGEFRWYVLQRRPSGLRPADAWLVEHGRPALSKLIRPGGWGPWRLDVPLVEVYDYRHYEAAVRAAGQ
jgi:hypothetical protein